MNTDINRYKSRGHFQTGTLLITLGVIFLLRQLNIIHSELQWYLITSIALATTGLAEMIFFKHWGNIINGLTTIALGAWFYVSFSESFGFTPSNSWPVILIIVGTGLMAKAIGKETSKPQNISQ
jgi:hypothetical protein